MKNKKTSKNIKPFPKNQHLPAHRWGHCDLWLKLGSPKGWRWPHMASSVRLSSLPTLQLPWFLPSWDPAPGLSSLQSQGGGKELRYFALHYNFQSASAAHMFSFNCLIPTTLFTQELIKFYQVSPIPLDFNPSFSSPRNTVDTLGWEILCGHLSLGECHPSPHFLHLLFVGEVQQQSERWGKRWRKKLKKYMINLSCLLRLE